MGQAAEIVKLYAAKYSDGTPDSYGTDKFLELFRDDAECSIAPTSEKPEGETGGVDIFRRGLEANASFLRNRKIELADVVEDGNRAAWTGVWSASIGVDGLPIPKGTQIRVHMAAFTEIKDGLIIRHREYLTAPEAPVA